MAFDEVSSPVLAKKFSTPDFNPDEFVKSVLSKCDIYRTLYDQRNNIQKLGEETAVSLKKNVYRNYRQFIDTAKEISYLEAEMYQLSHLLTEQKSIIVDQIETDIFERPKVLPLHVDPEIEANAMKKKSFLDSINVSKHLMDELKIKELLLEGDLKEFDPETYSPIQNISAHLLTDNLLITTKPTSGKADILNMFDLSDLAVVNVRDGQEVKNAFKILYSLETRMFGAETKDLKLLWLDQIERAKKNYKKGVQVDAQKLAEIKRKQEDQLLVLVQPEEKPKNKIEEPLEDSNRYPNLLNVDWLIELPEDLDMCIAQRDFEGAVQLVERGRTYLVDFPESSSLKDIRDKIEHRVEQLVLVLQKSLDNSSSSRHVSLRSIRVYVLLLIRLGRGKLACELFLRNRGFEIKNSFKQLKMEGATAIYIKKLASVFFTAIIETGREYKKNFRLNKNCSAFIVWAHHELQHFADKFSRQVFTRNCSLSALAVCINIAINECHRLEVIGMDLNFDLQHMFLKEILAAVFDARDQIIERSKVGAMEDQWNPVQFEPEGISTLQSELQPLGLNIGSPYVKGSTLHLSLSTINFAKSILIFLEESLQLYTTEMYDSLVQCVIEIFKTQSILFENLVKNPNLAMKRQFILVNAEFVYGKVFTQLCARFQSAVGHKSTALQSIQAMMERLRNLSS